MKVHVNFTVYAAYTLSHACSHTYAYVQVYMHVQVQVFVYKFLCMHIIYISVSDCLFDVIIGTGMYI